MTADINKKASLPPLRSRFGARRATCSYSRFGIAVTVYLVVANLLAVFMSTEPAFLILKSIFGLETAHGIFDSAYYIWIVQVVCMYLVGYPVFRLVLIGVPSQPEHGSSMSLAEFITAFLICMAGVQVGAYIGNIVTTVISLVTGYVPVDTSSILIANSPLWVVILVVVVIGPIFEELIFRRVFIDKLSRFGEKLAIVVSAVAFGLFHGNLNQFFFATLIGFVLGYVYTKTRRVRYTCLLHMLINFIGSAFVLFLSDSLSKIDEFLYLERELTDAEALALMTSLLSVYGYVLLQWALAIIGIVMFIIVLKNKKVVFTPKNKFALRPLDVPRVAIFNLGSLVFIAFSALVIFLSVYPIGY